MENPCNKTPAFTGQDIKREILRVKRVEENLRGMKTESMEKSTISGIDRK